MRVADYVFSFLADYGVRNVFMVSGGGAMFLNDALGRTKRIRHFCNHHEQASAIAAEGASRVSGALSVVSVTTGPGGTNALTGVIGQWLDSIPVLYLSGQVKFETSIASLKRPGLRQLGDQEINIIDIVRPVTKYAAMVTDPKDIRFKLEEAIHHATTGRNGPAWLDIPLNVQSSEIDPKKLKKFIPLKVRVSPIKKMDEIINAFSLAKAPVIVAGQGIRLAHATDIFKRLVDRVKCPVLGTFGGFDLLPTEHPCSCGRIGTIGTRAGNIALQNADFVLSIGTRNNIRQISYNWENFAKRARTKVVVDIDAEELAKETVQPTFAVCADAGFFMASLLRCLKGLQLPDRQKWLSWNRAHVQEYPIVLSRYHRVQNGVQPYAFTEELTRQIPSDAIVVAANATPSITLFQSGIVKKQRMFANSGCAAMGYGLPASLGAAAEANGKMVVCLEGDGSLMMNLQELQTAAHYNFPIKLFLFNNGEYSSIRQTQNVFFSGRMTGCTPKSGVSFPDWKKIADAFGWTFMRIDSMKNLEKKIGKALSFKGRIFCDVRLTKGYTFSPKLSSRRLEDGSLVSPSLEDMFPFLPRRTMNRNVYAK